MSKIKLLPCPFCGGEHIDYSVKTCGRWERKYHVAMYCKDCNCYGARVLITPTESTRYEVENNPKYKQLAIEKWNTRKPMERIVERLEECEEELKGLQYKSVNSYGYYSQHKGIELAKDIVKEEGGIE